MSDEWLVTCPGLVPVARATCTEATPPVAVPMPVSRASNPSSRHGAHCAWLARLWQKTWPSNSAGAVHDRRRQRHLVVDGGHVFGRHADLDHLQVLRRLEHAVADARRLDHAVAGAEDERRPLVLVDQPHPAAVAEDQLKADRVVVHHVGHRPGVGDADVGGDDAAAQPPRNQIPIRHAGPADDPGRLVFQAPHDEGMGGWRPLDWQVGIDEHDAHAVGRGELAPAGSHAVGVPAQQPQHTGRHRRSPAPGAVSRRTRRGWPPPDRRRGRSCPA